MSPLNRHQVADYEFRMERHRAELATCPRCGALGRNDLPLKDGGTEPDGEHCRNPITGLPLRGPAHFQRIDAANQLEHP